MIRVAVGTRKQPEASQELQILRQAEQFRRAAAVAWSPETIYPKSEYRPGCPDGQCGVTNFGFGLWLSRLGVVRASQLWFEEGEISNTVGNTIGSNHTWLRITSVDDGYTHSNLTLRVDLAGDQFAGIDTPAIVQYDDYFYPDPTTSSGNRLYEVAKTTAFTEYDTHRFKGRLAIFMQNIDDAAVLLR